MTDMAEHQAGPRLAITEPSGLPLDTIKALFTYFIITIVVVGGGYLLFIMRLDPPETGSGTLSLAFVGFVSAALTFLFGQEVQTRTARQAAASTAANTAADVAKVAAANSGVGVVTNGHSVTPAMAADVAATAENTATIAENTAKAEGPPYENLT